MNTGDPVSFNFNSDAPNYIRQSVIRILSERNPFPWIIKECLATFMEEQLCIVSAGEYHIRLYDSELILYNNAQEKLE